MRKTLLKQPAEEENARVLSAWNPYGSIQTRSIVPTEGEKDINAHYTQHRAGCHSSALASKANRKAAIEKLEDL